MVKDQAVMLPEGVTVAEWSLEKVSWQNPRIRAFLGCIRLLGGVLESNYAILHCSPERLLEIWRKVRKVAELIQTNVAPLLQAPSSIPRLEDARLNAEMALRMLTRTVIIDLERFPVDHVPHDRLLELRKLLCVSIGQLHSFLQDTFGEVIAADPRSLHDADYFLSRRFPQDIDEAEWLHSTVLRLQEYMEGLEEVRPMHLSRLVTRMQEDKLLPQGKAWSEAATFLNLLLDGLTSKLKGVLALRGIRFYEMEILDRYADEIPTKCRTVLELYQVGQRTLAHLRTVMIEAGDEPRLVEQALRTVHGSFSARTVELMSEIDQCLRDLAAFVPLWLEGIEKRRALMLKRQAEEQQH